MAVSGDRIEKLVRRHFRMLVRLAASRLCSAQDAEDVVQDVFLKVLEGKVDFIDESHEQAWLVRATINKALDVRKRASRRDAPLDENAIAAAPETQPFEDDGGRIVLECMRKLTGKYAIPLHLHYYKNYRQQEIASMLRLPAATVRTCIARGRKRLESMIKEEPS